jgi:acetyl esterase/lipase
MRRVNVAEDDAVHAVIERVRSVYARWRRDTPVTQMRSDWDALFGAEVRAAVMDVDAAGVSCQWIRAPRADPAKVIVYFHGGGFHVGSLVSHREVMAELSAASGASVLGVAYRLSPEHSYPAPLEDALAVMQWLAVQSFGAGDIALAGDSAGANLALSLLLALQDANASMPVAAYLMSAWTDLTASGESYETRASLDPIHQRSMILAMARGYLGVHELASSPLASPMFAAPDRLAALPPLLLQVGERETVVSDSEVFARKVRAAGGQADLEIWPGMIHVFQQFPSQLTSARKAIDVGGAFLATHLGVQSLGEPLS